MGRSWVTGSTNSKFNAVGRQIVVGALRHLRGGLWFRLDVGRKYGRQQKEGSSRVVGCGWWLLGGMSAVSLLKTSGVRIHAGKERNWVMVWDLQKITSKIIHPSAQSDNKNAD